MADATSTTSRPSPPPPSPSPSTPRRPEGQPRASSGSGRSRRQSTRERIDEILEVGIARAESRSAPASQAPSPLPQQQQQHRQNDRQPEPQQEQQQRHTPHMESLLRGASRPGRIQEAQEDDSDVDAHSSMLRSVGNGSGSRAIAQPPNYQSTATTTTATLPPRRGGAQPSGGDIPSPAGAEPADGAATQGVVASLKKTLRSFGSVELENKGSVARDHLALERTFLAWLRTSVSFASIGIAVTQLFRLNTTLNSGEGGGAGASAAGQHRDELRRLGKPLGAAFLVISILILFLGYSRYVRSQRWIMTGRFPASRGTVVLVTLLTFAVMVASLAIVVVFSPGARVS